MWIIDIDHTAEPYAELGTNMNAVGVHSRDYIEGAALPHRFRMYDDDFELYYEGRTDSDDFAPLDDFGTPNAGCTTIRYLFKGSWCVL